jgi:hypothetical protein
MGSVQREVLSDEVAFTDEVMLLHRNRPEVVLDVGQDELQPLSALRAAAWFTIRTTAETRGAFSAGSGANSMLAHVPDGLAPAR